MTSSWMIYGANGYTGELIARTAAQKGMTPVLAGRSEEKIQPLAEELGLKARIFSLDETQQVKQSLEGIDIVLHCAGPFSVTSPPMIEGCLAAGAHYLDITGEINVFEHVHHPHQSTRAVDAGIVLCSGVGFDVIPTDCLAHKLKELVPDATSLSLGFDSNSKISPGTMRTMIEGLGSGSLKRQDGQIVHAPLGQGQRDIDFGQGVRSAVSIPWGDVSTAYHTTGVANIDTWIPMPKPMIMGMYLLNAARPILEKEFIQNSLKKLVNQFVKGPDETERKSQSTFIWGEARNNAGETKTIRIQTANVYEVTIEGALAAVNHLLEHKPQGGSYTPSILFGDDLIEKLPGSGSFQLS